MNTDKQIRWIPTNEKNPSKNGRYLAVCKEFKTPVIRLYQDGWSSIQEVTHWMPLPRTP